MRSVNFSFLDVYDDRLSHVAMLAERYFADDPSTCLIKLRQFAEVMGGLVAHRTGQLSDPREAFVDRLRRLQDDRIVPREAADLFHRLRRLGNHAAHEVAGSRADALSGLKMARELAV